MGKISEDKQFELGRKGEMIMLELLQKLRSAGLVTKITRPDFLIRTKAGDWMIVAAKHQDVFEPPPFYGHGLCKYQVTDRLLIEKETGIKTYLAVCDKSENIIYGKHLGELEKGRHKDTNIANKRIYDLKNFRYICKYDESDNLIDYTKHFSF